MAAERREDPRGGARIDIRTRGEEVELAGAGPVVGGPAGQAEGEAQTAVIDHREGGQTGAEEMEAHRSGERQGAGEDRQPPTAPEPDLGARRPPVDRAPEGQPLVPGSISTLTGRSGSSRKRRERGPCRSRRAASRVRIACMSTGWRSTTQAAASWRSRPGGSPASRNRAGRSCPRGTPPCRRSSPRRPVGSMASSVSRSLRIFWNSSYKAWL